jgi:chromosome partitioning protein
MGKIIAIANQKGGVGKTTTAINLSASIALAGREILVVDIDPQGNTTSGLGFDRSEIASSIYDVFSGGLSIQNTILETEVENLGLIPSSIDLIAAEVELVDVQGREFVLKNALQAIEDRYEFIIIDCPPSLGLLTLNGLVAAHSVLVPVQCEYYALEGLGMLSRTIELVQSAFNPELQIEGVLLTMFDRRTSISHQVAEDVRRFFGDRVYTTVIPRNVTLSEAPSFGKPVMLYDARSTGAQSYLKLAKEILNEASTGQRA